MAKSGSSMQVTRAADYGVRALILLADLAPEQRLFLPELAERAGVPSSFLSKVLQALIRAGFVSSSRGRAGGFRILAAGRSATIRSVIEAIDGPIRLNVCVDPNGYCTRKGHCPAHPVWARAQASILRVLETEVISDFIRARTPVIQLGNSQAFLKK